ncbi:hypothetical protein BS78_02G186700 [Paspalum vaginatum]|nr:hypothetical protein BS78_02G186700 [Paspalum vaginatum]
MPARGTSSEYCGAELKGSRLFSTGRRESAVGIHLVKKQ